MSKYLKFVLVPILFIAWSFSASAATRPSTERRTKPRAAPAVFDRDYECLPPIRLHALKERLFHRDELEMAVDWTVLTEHKLDAEDALFFQQRATARPILKGDLVIRLRGAAIAMHVYPQSVYPRDLRFENDSSKFPYQIFFGRWPRLGDGFRKVYTFFDVLQVGVMVFTTPDTAIVLAQDFEFVSVCGNTKSEINRGLLYGELFKFLADDRVSSYLSCEGALSRTYKPH